MVKSLADDFITLLTDMLNDSSRLPPFLRSDLTSAINLLQNNKQIRSNINDKDELIYFILDKILNPYEPLRTSDNKMAFERFLRKILQHTPPSDHPTKKSGL